MLFVTSWFCISFLREGDLVMAQFLLDPKEVPGREAPRLSTEMLCLMSLHMSHLLRDQSLAPAPTSLSCSSCLSFTHVCIRGSKISKRAWLRKWRLFFFKFWRRSQQDRCGGCWGYISLIWKLRFPCGEGWGYGIRI